MARRNVLALLRTGAALPAAEVRPTIVHVLEYSTTKTDALASSVLVTPTTFTDYTNTSGARAKKDGTSADGCKMPRVALVLGGVRGVVSSDRSTNSPP